jgi:4-hydroxy-3-polyprenylbenzoate decarboxylase
MQDSREVNFQQRLVIGMSGASGAILGIEILKILRAAPGWESHLVISKGAEETIRQETPCHPDEVKALADAVYSIHDIGAAIASGTFRTAGMVIVPCSMKTVAGVACGYSDNLLLRAADVTIKERRKLVLVARECPLSPIHLRNLLALAELGAIIMPPMLTYYNHPAAIADLERHLVAKILDPFRIEVSGFRRWGEPGSPS